MQAGDAAENVGRPVARIVVQERSAAGELVLEIRQLAAARAAIDVVLAADASARCGGRPAPRCEVGQISTSSSTTSPGLSGCFLSWV